MARHDCNHMPSALHYVTSMSRPLRVWRCRSLAQLLVVLDDGDLHQRQTPFSLGASRAIASTLNSLVFHTAFPETAGQQQQQPGQHLKQQPAAELSAQVAPATLAHGMVSTGSTATVLSAGLSCRTLSNTTQGSAGYLLLQACMGWWVLC